MRVPMLALAAVCVLIGLSAPVVAPGLANAVAGAMNTPPGAARAGLNAAVSPLAWVVGVSAAGLALILVLAALRKRLLAARTVGAAGTWDCGYVRPTARMQYTASSFAQPVLDVFPLARGTRYRQVQPAGVLPAPVSFSTETKDLFRNRFYEPFFKRTAEVLSWFRRAQHGRVQLYVLYLALALIVLLVFGLK